MSDSGNTERFWRERDAGIPAVERVQVFVRSVTRARRLQLLHEYLMVGLFFGLLAASALVVAVRAGLLSVPMWPFAAATVVAALAVAVLIALTRLPAMLDAAIAADLRLNLRQRLSTAFEYIAADGTSSLSRGLARQAVRARLPARPELTFPSRLTTFGRLLPLAVVLLLVASMLEFETSIEESAQAVDALVVHEGVRLRDYARHMHQRARSKALARSAAAARQLERLGSRMESGTLGRERVLSRLQDMARTLDEERRAALLEADQTPVGPITTQELEGAAADSPSMRRLLDGSLSAEDAARLAREADQMLLRAATDEELEQARRELEAGDPSAMQRILERAVRSERARNDARALDEARSRVERSRENLGDRPTRRGSRPEDAQRAEGFGEQGMDEGAGGDVGEGMDSGDYDSGAPGSGYGREAARERRSAPIRKGSPDARTVIRPESSLGEGRVFTSKARVLPREGTVNTPRAEVAVEFEAQMEAVLARDDVPLHYKEFVRRYFLNLNEGVRREGTDR